MCSSVQDRRSKFISSEHIREHLKHKRSQRLGRRSEESSTISQRFDQSENEPKGC